jgi:hypothetical protein
MIQLCRIIKERIDDPIRVYKKGSSGNIFVDYNSLSEFIDKEASARGIRKSSSNGEYANLIQAIEFHLKGKRRSTTVFHLNYRGVIKFNK